jgi:DNA repair exonuclease SbcCD ATPase subunit/DNA repair exonuclease SbcCD nuclease subunit
MKKTAICTDLHLNNANFGQIDKNGLSFRTKDFMAAFEFFVDQCVNVVKPDRVVIPGDIYENPNPPNPVRRFFNRMLKKLSNAGIQVKILPGNHDSCYFSHALQPIEEAGFENVTICSKVEMVVEDDCAMIFIPHTEAIERRETSHKMVVREFGIQNAVEITTAKLAGLAVLAFGHFGVYGVEMNDGIINHNKEDVSLNDLSELGADYIFLGHFHMTQDLDVKGAIMAMYVGSLERSTFNDTSAVKSFVVLETERGKPSKLSRVEYSGARKLVTISGNMQEITKGVQNLKDSLQTGESEPIVKLKFIGNINEYAEFCKTKKSIRNDLGMAKHIKFEKDVDDPTKRMKAESVKNQITDKSDIGSADILEIFNASIESSVADLDDRKAIIDMATSIVKSVNDKDKARRGVVPGRTRIHGVKLQNFQMYGTEKNIVEFDQGCKPFFGRSWGKVDNWAVIGEESKAFLETLSEDDRKLISIIGKIEGNEAESNGSGKSSILDAISWAFYEKIVRDFFDKESSKSSSTMSVVRTIDGQPERECFVEVLFSAGNSLYLIRRERKCSSLEKHSGGCLLYCLYSPENVSDAGSMTGRRGADAEEFINQLVSMDFDTFSNSVMFGQSDADKFIRGTDKTKKEIFVKILGLMIIDEYLKETRDRLSFLAKELVSLRSQSQALISNSMTNDEVVAAEALILNYKNQAIDLRAKIVEFEKTIVNLRADPIFNEKTELASTIEVLKATISQKTEESTKSGKADCDAVLQEEARLLKFQQSLNVAEREVISAKENALKLKNAMASFDEAACEKSIKYGKEAVKAKPIRDAEKAELLAKKEAIMLDLATHNGTIASLQKDHQKFKNALIDMGENSEAKCPECENPVSKSHIEQKIKGKEEEQTQLINICKTIREPLEGIKTSISEVDVKLANIEKFTLAAQVSASQLATHEANKVLEISAKTRTEEAEKRYQNDSQAVESSRENLVSLRDKVKKNAEEAATSTATVTLKLKEQNLRMETVINPRKLQVEADIADFERQIKEASIKAGNADSGVAATTAKIEVFRKTESKIQQISKDILSKTTDQTRLGCVEDAFGLDGVRVQIIEKYIPLLNVYIEEFMNVISDKMSMTVVTDGKRDGKMEIKISGSSGSDPRQLSKGQFAKLKVATDLALGMMSLARNENAPDFVCLDEVFAPVDTSGKHAMFDVITKLQEYFRMVLVISHDPLIQDTIKDTIVVNMVNDYSTIEKQAHEH